jgi:hypothetical protein
MAFQDSTRRKFMQLGTLTKGTVSPLQWDIPKTGFLAGIYLNIVGTVAGTLSVLNAVGKASIVRRVRLITNAGIDLVNISGAGYHYLLRNHLEDYKDPVPQSDARSVVAAAAFNLDMYIPIALNSRDPVGLFMLQNEQTLVQLQVEFEADTTVATGATVTATVTPFVEVFTVPVKTSDWPPLNLVQQILEDTRPVAAVGNLEYSWPRGNSYVQVLHAYGIAATGPADSWTRAQVIVNQSETLMDYTPGGLNIEYGKMHGVARLVGTIPLDLMGTSGLGTFGSSRDMFYSAMVTELMTRVAISAQPNTFYTVRRQLVALR